MGRPPSCDCHCECNRTYDGTVNGVVYGTGVVDDLFWPNTRINGASGATAPIVLSGSSTPPASYNIRFSPGFNFWPNTAGGGGGLIHVGLPTSGYGGRYLSASGAAFSQSRILDSVRTRTFEDAGVSTETAFVALRDGIDNCASHAGTPPYSIRQVGPIWFADMQTLPLLEWSPFAWSPTYNRLIGGIIGTDTSPRLYRQFGNPPGHSEMTWGFDSQVMSFSLNFQGSSTPVMPWNAPAADVEAELAIIAPGLFTVTLGTATGRYVIQLVIGQSMPIGFTFTASGGGILSYGGVMNTAPCGSEVLPNDANLLPGPFTDLEFEGYHILGPQVIFNPCDCPSTIMAYLFYSVTWLKRVPVDSTGYFSDSTSGVPVTYPYIRNGFLQYGTIFHRIVTFKATNVPRRPNQVVFLFESDVLSGTGWIRPNPLSADSREIASLPSPTDWADFVASMASMPYSPSVTGEAVTLGAMPDPSSIACPNVIDFSSATITVDVV